MEIKGQVKKVFKKTFEKKDGSGLIEVNEIWVEELKDTYPQSGIFEVGKNTNMPSEGDIVTIQFSMSTNEWQDKVFGKNRAWKVEINEQAHVSAPDPLSPTTAAPNQPWPSTEAGGGEDDLPF